MKHHLKKQPIRYVLSGIVSFAIENISFMAFYYLADLQAASANILSIMVALLVNFFTTKFFVFNNKSTKKNTLKQALQYIILVVFNGFISTYMIVKLIELGVSGYIAKPIIALVVIAWTYIIYRVIFKKG